MAENNVSTKYRGKLEEECSSAGVAAAAHGEECRRMMGSQDP
jgi:hypothetical protein